MNRRLILVLALAFVVGIAFAAYAEVQNVKVSGDISAISVVRRGFNLGGAADQDRAEGTLGITRVRIDADLTDNVVATVRLLNERVWGTLDESNTSTDIDLDLAYVTLKEFLNNKVTLALGKQPLRIGNALLVGDPDTNRLEDNGVATFLPTQIGDLSVRKAFDGVVAVLDFSPLKVTAGFVKGVEGNLAGAGAAYDDVDVYLANFAYDTGVKNTKVELTALYDNRVHDDTGAYGALVSSSPIENLNLSAEAVYQRSKVNRNDDRSTSDTAVQLMADYTLAGMKMAPKIGLDYTHLTENWNALFEDQTPADIANLILPNTNLQVVGASLSVKPMDDLNVKLRYANLALVKRMTTTLASAYNGVAYTMDTGKKELGDEVDLSLTYDYTEDVQFGLSGGYFKQGHAFSKPTHYESAGQVIGSMKVSF